MGKRGRKKIELTREVLEKKDPINTFARRWLLPQDMVLEILRMCEVDFRFADGSGRPRYSSISFYLKRFWKIDLPARKIRYFHKVYLNYLEAKRVLSKTPDGRLKGVSYREFILLRNT